MFEGFTERQQRRVEALEAAYDGLLPPETEIIIERRVRIVAGLYRAVKLAIQLDGMIRVAAAPQEDNEDGMRLRHDPETVERKHRLLSEGLARVARDLERSGAPKTADQGGTGGRGAELAHEGQPRAA